MKIVFDFDGTLLNSTARHFLVLRKCLIDHGYLNVSIDDFLIYKSDGNTTESYLSNKLLLNKSESKIIATDWVNIIEDLKYIKTDCLYDDAIPVLEFCLQRKYVLYLVSARKSQYYLNNQVQKLKISTYFSNINCVSPKDAINEKSKYISDMGADIIIGDTEIEVEAAKKSGIPYYVINRGFRSKQYWESLNIKSYDTLYNLFNILE